MPNLRFIGVRYFSATPFLKFIFLLSIVLVSLTARAVRLDVRANWGLSIAGQTFYDGEPRLVTQPYLEGWEYGLGVNYEPLTATLVTPILGASLARHFAASELQTISGAKYKAIFELQFAQASVGAVYRHSDGVWFPLELGMGKAFASKYKTVSEDGTLESPVNSTRYFAQTGVGFDGDASSMFAFGLLGGFELLLGEVVPEDTSKRSVFEGRQIYTQLFFEYRFINQPSVLLLKRQLEKDKEPPEPLVLPKKLPPVR